MSIFGKNTQNTLFPQFVLERMQKHLDIFFEKIWKDTVTVEVSISEVNLTADSYAEAVILSYKRIKNGTIFARSGWNLVWFRADLPEELVNDDFGIKFLLWKVNGEATVYADGIPWCGLDTAHTWCRLPENQKTIYIKCGTYQTGLWMRTDERKLPDPVDQNLVFYEAAVSRRDHLYWKMYNDLRLLYELTAWQLDRLGYSPPQVGYHKPLDEIPPYLRTLLYKTDKCMDLYDSGDWEACEKMLNMIVSHRSDPSNGSLAVVGNSHLDLVWLWPESIAREKNIHTCATMLRLMEQYPDMKFAMSQPRLLDDIHQDHPELYRQIKLRSAEGRWELTGGMYVESDTLLPSGEGLVRSFILGQQFFENETGKPSEVLWLPDAFGYSQCIPQIAQAAGIKYFYTTKLSWSVVNRFPYTSFIWEGLDGSALISYISQVGYEARGTIDEVMKCSYTNKQAGISNQALLALGFGDGGGGLTDEQCERVERLKDFTVLPSSTWSGVKEFFSQLANYIDDLPLYRGELYLEYHRGIYTTMHWMKQAYRAAERTMQTLEASLACTVKSADLDLIWKRLVFMQFHDALPGSSIQEVYKKLIPELESIRKKLLMMAKSNLGNDSGAYSLFNPHGIAGTWIHLIDSLYSGSYNSLRVTDESGSDLLTQKLKDGTFITHISLEGLEGKRLLFSESEGIAVKDIKIQDTYKLEHDIVKIEYTDTLAIEKLEIEGETIPLTSVAQFIIHKDIPAKFDAWEVDHSSVGMGSIACHDMKLSIAEHGPLLRRVYGEGSLGRKSSLTVSYSLVKDSPYLFISMKVNWQEEHCLLRYEIPTAYTGMTGRFGTPFGSIDRLCLSGGLSQEAQWEQPASRWIAITDGVKRGLSIISSESYGFSIHDGMAGISLLRSPCSSDEQSIEGESIFTEKGIHKIEFAIGPYNSVTHNRRVSTAQAADTLYTLPVNYNGRAFTSPWKLEKQGSLVISWVKPTADNSGYIIRFHEAAGLSGRAELHILDNDLDSAWYTDLLENNLEIVPIKEEVCTIIYSPYKLISLKLIRIK